VVRGISQGRAETKSSVDGMTGVASGAGELRSPKPIAGGLGPFEGPR
jgi:hypothetical protein